MAYIKVTRGGCGIRYTDANGNARHALKTPADGPFAVDDAQASRLVKLGVAEYVRPLDNSAPIEPEDAVLGDTEGGEDIAPAADPGKVSAHLDPEQLATMDYNALKKLAADMGVKPAGTKKADYIAAIAAVEVEPGEPADTDEDGDELPELNAADPE